MCIVSMESFFDSEPFATSTTTIKPCNAIVFPEELRPIIRWNQTGSCRLKALILVADGIESDPRSLFYLLNSIIFAQLLMAHNPSHS